MRPVKKFWGIWVFITVLLIAGYVFTRLYHLTILPIFTDEAIYIRWSQIGTRDASWRFISLVDGKQPLFTWIMMVLLRLIKDPLVAGRLVSVISGAASMVGVWFLSYELFKDKRISFLSSLLYLISPFTLMYDRLALYDSLVATFSVWNLYLAILLVRYVRLDIALIFGMTLGAGILNKSSGFLSIYMIPATLVLFDFKKKNIRMRLLRWTGLVAVAVILSQAMYGVLRLSPLFHMITLKDSVFVYSFSEWLSHPFNFVQGNLHGLFDWLIHYLTWPVFIISLLPALLFWKQGREKILLYVWWFAPMLALAMFGRVLYPRFVLFMSLPLLILSAVGIMGIVRRIPSKAVVIILCGILFYQSVMTDYWLLTNPLKAPIPKADRGQIIDDWPAGWGVTEVNAFITGQSKHSKVSLYTDGTFGLFPYAFEIYQVDNPNVFVKGIWPMPEKIPEVILKDASDHPTFFVFNQYQLTPKWPIEFVAQYQKGNNANIKMRLFRVNPALVNK